MRETRQFIIFLSIYLVINCLILTATSGAARADGLEVYYLFAKGERAQVSEPIELAADALGISITPSYCEKIPNQVIGERSAGVIISPEVALTEPECLRTLLAKLPSSKPVLFPGIRDRHREALKLLGFPVAITTDSQSGVKPQELIVHPTPLASFFGGLRLVCRADESIRLALPGSRPIIGFADSSESALYLVTKEESGREYFLLSGTHLVVEKPLLASDNLLIQALPYLVFFAKAGGDRVWQGSGLFANLTIDDPFLVEPYGNLSFSKLLEQMDAHRFHTTISFIPRNFDRNEKGTVALFKSRPDRFSVAIHGNNHDRREFYRYSSKDLLEPFAIKTLQEQEFNLAQALVRMKEFTRLTGIPYDPVMIFPQEIAPAPTLKYCKQLGYVATINGSNVPLDLEVPRRVQMSFRPYNTSVSDFLSIRRVRVNHYSEIQIRADLFMGNPLFLYSHQDLFDAGIDRFNAVADLINNVCPGIEWKSLGEILSHWFIWRRTDSKTLEVRMLSPACVIGNNGKEREHYEISKEEGSGTEVLSVTINGNVIPWKRDSGRLLFGLDLAPGGSGHVVIQYAVQPYPGMVGLHGGTPKMVFLWRGLAEFRDRVLSRFMIGRLVRDLVYESGLSVRLPLLVIILFILVIIGFVVRRTVRSRSGKRSIE